MDNVLMNKAEIIEQAREMLLWGHLPDWQGLGVYFVVSLFVAWLGFAWFQETCRCFIRSIDEYSN